MIRKRVLYLTAMMIMLTGALFAAGPGDVVINEVAWMGTDESTGHEWLELYNNTGSDVDLTDWTIESDGEVIADLSDTSDMNNSTISASGYYLIEYKNTDGETSIKDIVGDFQGLGYQELGNNPIGERVLLKNFSGNIIDEIDCSSVDWFGGDSDEKATMERRFPEQDSNDEANWGTNNRMIRNGWDADGNPINGTPRAKNSIYAAAMEDLEGVLTVEDSPFFPHGDIPDRTTTSIGYKIENDAEVSIRIYNVEGNLKANILENESVSGSVSPHTKVWDGTGKGGDIVPVGIYIVHIKIVEDDTGDITTEQATAVVGRKF